MTLKDLESCSNQECDDMCDCGCTYICKRCQSALILGRYLFSVFEKYGREMNGFGITEQMVKDYKQKRLRQP